MKLFNITLLFASIASSTAQAHRNLAVCEDKRGKFYIPELEGLKKRKNCQYVRKYNMDLCSSNKVLNKCPKTCGLCDPDQVLAVLVDTEVKACIDVRGKFSIPQLEGAEKNCQFVRKNDDMDLCARSWKVRNLCPKTCDVECASDEDEALVHDHEVPVEAVCEDKSGRFQIHNQAGTTPPKKNCQYIRNFPNYCTYWMVREHCPKTCGTCDEENV